MTRSVALAFACLLLAGLLAIPRDARAAQSYDNCTGFITTLPAVINTPGTWCLNQNLTTAITTGSAIQIQSDHVVLDCNHFGIDGRAAGVLTQAYGIAAVDRLSVTVRRCTVRGFWYGLFFQDSGSQGTGGGHLVEDNVFDFNTFSGLMVQGDGSIVRRNRVFATGGSGVSPDADGLITYYSVNILDNVISGVKAAGGATLNSPGVAAGIVTFSNHGGSVKGNRVRGLVKKNSGQAQGIFNTGSDRLILRDNDVVGDAAGGNIGSAGSVGLSCVATVNDDAIGNVVNGFETAIAACHDAGGNTIVSQ